jgi:DNA-binding MarR family transcriptional regulator
VEGSFGKVLKKAIGREEEAEQKSRLSKKSLFVNPTRQKIFQYLCERPCSHLRRIARELNISVPTAEWHLKKFVEKDVLRAVMMENKYVYYPSNMMDPEDINIIWCLNNDKSKLIYETIMDAPGITQKKICEKTNLYQQAASSYTTKLEEVGLIVSQREGRFKRYTITNHPYKILRSKQKRRKYFREWIIKILKEEGLNPKVLRIRDGEMRIQIKNQGKTSILRINIDPLSCLF